MNEAEMDPRMSKATREQLIARRQAVWDEYMRTGEDESVKAPPPKVRFADPMAEIKAGRTGR